MGGLAVGIAVAAIVIAVLRKRKRRRQKKPDEGPPVEAGSDPLAEAPAEELDMRAKELPDTLPEMHGEQQLELPADEVPAELGLKSPVDQKATKFE